MLLRFAPSRDAIVALLAMLLAVSTSFGKDANEAHPESLIGKWFMEADPDQVMLLSSPWTKWFW
jgi:hypothetical protein